MTDTTHNETVTDAGDDSDSSEASSLVSYTADLFRDIVAELTGLGPDDIRIKVLEGDRLAMFLVELRDRARIPRLIGSKGVTIKALKSLITAIGGSHGRIYKIEIVEDKKSR